MHVQIHIVASVDVRVVGKLSHHRVENVLLAGVGQLRLLRYL